MNWLTGMLKDYEAGMDCTKEEENCVLLLAGRSYSEIISEGMTFSRYLYTDFQVGCPKFLAQTDVLVAILNGKLCACAGLSQKFWTTDLKIGVV